MLKQPFARIFGPMPALSKMKVTGAVCSIEGGMNICHRRRWRFLTMAYDCAPQTPTLTWECLEHFWTQIKACDIISNQGTRIQWIGFVGKIFTGNHVFFYFCHQIDRGFLYTVKQMFPLSNFSDSTSLRHFQRCSPPRESPFAVRKRRAAGLPVGWL